MRYKLNIYKLLKKVSALRLKIRTMSNFGG